MTENFEYLIEMPKTGLLSADCDGLFFKNNQTITLSVGRGKICKRFSLF